MIARLMREHADLRRLAKDLEDSMGLPGGAGWDDCTRCDIARLKAAQEKLSKRLLEHEDEEKRLLTDSFQKEGSDPAVYGREIEKSSETLAHLIGMMRTVTTLYDGSHAYALRGAVERVRQALDEHLAREEKTLFPLLKRTAKDHHRV